jgi:hypothetical protein
MIHTKTPQSAFAELTRAILRAMPAGQAEGTVNAHRAFFDAGMPDADLIDTFEQMTAQMRTVAEANAQAKTQQKTAQQET